MRAVDQVIAANVREYFINPANAGAALTRSQIAKAIFREDNALLGHVLWSMANVAHELDFETNEYHQNVYHWAERRDSPPVRLLDRGEATA